MPRRRAPVPPQAAPEWASGFGRKLAWLAVRTDDPGPVVTALGVREARAATWPEAVDAAYDGATLITPPLPGPGGDWVLVAGVDLDVSSLLDRLPGLSQRLGEVQLFATQRVSGYAAWARAVDGRLLRVFERGDGELLRWVGAPEDAERALGLDPLDGLATLAAVLAWDEESVDDGLADDAYRWLEMDEDCVGRLAAAWSICPFDLALGPDDPQPTVGALP